MLFFLIRAHPCHPWLILFFSSLCLCVSMVPFFSNAAHGAGLGLELEPVAPVPEHGGVVAEQKRAGQVREAQSEQLAHRRRQQGCTDTPSGVQRTHENPRQVRPAEAERDAVRRRRSVPRITVKVAWVAFGKQRDENGPDRPVFRLAERQETRLLNPWTIRSGTRPLQANVSRLFHRGVIQAAKRLLAVKCRSKKPFQIRKVRRCDGTESGFRLCIREGR